MKHRRDSYVRWIGILTISLLFTAQAFARQGDITTIAGGEFSGFLGDGGPVEDAQIRNPRSITLDESGNIFFWDSGNRRVRRIDAETGIITTVAGGAVGDGALGIDATLNVPRGVAVDASGNIYVADTSNNRIRKVDAETGIISTVAGTGVGDFFDEEGPATDVSTSFTTDVSVGADGNIFIVAANQVRKVDADGNISSVTGKGDSQEDGILAIESGRTFIPDIFVDASGNIYFTSWDNNHRIRKVDTDGIITTVAGGGDQNADNVLATDASLNGPRGVFVDAEGNIYIGEASNHRVRKVDAETGNITTVAGTGQEGSSGDGELATDAQLNNPYGVVVDGSGNLYIADRSNRRVRKVDTDGIITTVAGGGEDRTANGVLATEARLLSNPSRVDVDGSGNLYIANANVISKVDTDGIITTVVGGGSDIGVEEGPATDAVLAANNGGLAVDGSGNLYIADLGHARVRKVDPSGNISTFAGNGINEHFGDGGLATDASLASIQYIGPQKLDHSLS